MPVQLCSVLILEQAAHNEQLTYSMAGNNEICYYVNYATSRLKSLEIIKYGIKLTMQFSYLADSPAL